MLDSLFGYRIYTASQRESASCGEGFGKEMRRTLTALLGLVIIFGAAGTSRAEVKRVQMHIGGYLCGN